MIKVSVDEFWEYFQTYKGDLVENCHCIAESEADNVKVWLSNEGGLPAFEVEESGNNVMTLRTEYKLQAEDKYEQILDTFIDCETEDDEEDENFFDKSEIRCAAEDFLNALVGYDVEEYEYTDDDVTDFIEYCYQYVCDYFGYH